MKLLKEDYLDNIESERLEEIRKKLIQLDRDIFSTMQLGNQEIAKKLRKADDIVVWLKYDCDEALGLKWNDWE